MTPNVGFVEAAFPCSLKSGTESPLFARASASGLTSGPAGPSSPRYPGCPVLPGSPWKTTRPPIMSSPVKDVASLIKSLLASRKFVLVMTIYNRQTDFKNESKDEVDGRKSVAEFVGIFWDIFPVTGRIESSASVCME